MVENETKPTIKQTFSKINHIFEVNKLSKIHYNDEFY